MKMLILFKYAPAIFGAGILLLFASFSSYFMWGLVVVVCWLVFYIACYQLYISRLSHAGEKRINRLELGIPDLGSEPSLFNTLNKHRHDWMNEIQLLLSYAQLQKYDKLRSTVEALKCKAVREGQLFHLGVEKLVLYLYSLQADKSTLQLDLRLQNNLQLKLEAMHADQLALIFIHYLELVKKHSVTAEEINKLILEMYKDEEGLHFIIHYEGAYERKQLWERYGHLKKQIIEQWRSVSVEKKEEDRRFSIALKIENLAS